MRAIPKTRHLLSLLGAGLWAGVLADRQEMPTQRSEVSVQVHEGTGLSFDLSPDGRWLVLELLGELWKLPAGGGEAVALTDAVRDTAEAHEPRWAPDGTRIVFWRGFGRDFGVQPLWVLSLDSGHARALAADTIRLSDPAWHPSGKTLVVVHSPSRARPDDRLSLYDLATGALTILPAPGLPPSAARRLAEPAWSPDGRMIAVVDGAADGPVWEVDVVRGGAVRLTADGVRAKHPVYSPDGTAVAYVAPDSDGNAQLWMQQRGARDRRQVTTTTGNVDRLTTPFGRVVWTPDGRRLVFARSGRLWSIPLEGGAVTEIRFSATVRFTQVRPAFRPLRFAAPGSEQRARGFMGIALAPNADRVALIALDSLWLVTVDGRATSIARVRENASGLAWSPDGRTLAWSAGRNGEEDLYATDIATRATHALTALPGQESRPAWSPDGRQLAFLHAEPRGRGTVGRLRVVAVDGALVERTDQTMDLGVAPGAAPFTPLGTVPEWSRDGSSVFLATGGQIVVSPLQGARRTLRLPAAASAVRWISDDSVVFLRENQLHAARVGPDSTAVASEQRLSEDAALYPSARRDGAVLYVSADGLRLRRPNGATTRIGWPLRFRTPAPPDMVIRNVRVVEAGKSARELSDILVTRGRIERIAPAGRIRSSRGADVVDAAGRFIIPGLIDSHAHPESEAQLRGALYFGVTTMRDLGNPIARVAGMRDAVAAGAMPGPRIILGGFQFAPGCSSSGDACGTFSEFVQQPRNDTVAARGLDLAQAFGTETAKLYQPISLAGARRFLDMAHRRGLRVTGHFGHDLPLLASGMDGEEHTGLFGPTYDDVAALAHAAGLVITPTLTPNPWAMAVASDTAIFSTPELAGFTDPAARRFFSGPPFERSQRASMEQSNRDHRATVRRLHDASVMMGAGTDLSAPAWGLHIEMEELVASGLSPAEALSAATLAGAQILGVEREIGAIRPGLIADLVILDADPLADIRNTRSIWAVIQSGRVIDRPALLRARQR